MYANCINNNRTEFSFDILLNLSLCNKKRFNAFLLINIKFAKELRLIIIIAILIKIRLIM